MVTIGGICGFGGSDEESIILFNELSKRGEPMGKYHTFAVFPERSGPVPEHGKAYYCYLRKDSKANVYWATIQSEITLESILSMNTGLKKELANIILEEYPDAFKSEINALQIKDYESRIREKYKTENASLRSKIEHLENELSKLSEISRKELGLVPDSSETGVENGLLYDKFLEDGEYSVRLNTRKTKALFIKCDGGEYYCTDGYIDISPFLKKYNVTKTVCKHCEEMVGALLNL